MYFYKTTYIRGEKGHLHESRDGERIVCYQKHGKVPPWYKTLIGVVVVETMLVIILMRVLTILSAKPL